MTKPQFKTVLADLAGAWARRDYKAAAAFFAQDVRYADPLRYSFEGNDALRAFFEADEGQDQRTTWHTIIFDEERQEGAVEYTYEGSYRYHGVALVRVADGKIARWREHQHVDSRSWDEFAGTTLDL